MILNSFQRLKMKQKKFHQADFENFRKILISLLQSTDSLSVLSQWREKYVF